jgi:DNA-binding XRE family transcriptional regulator
MIPHTTPVSPTMAAPPPPIRTRRPGQWCWLDTAAIATYGPRIGAYGVAVYAVLAAHANGRTQACWPSINRIASLLKLSRSTVKTTLRTLRHEGLIAVDPRQDPAGDPTTNSYTLLDPTPEIPATVAAVPQGGRSPDDPPSATTHPTGGLPATPKPDPCQQEERTSKASDDRAAHGKREEPKDETSPWNTPPVLLPETPTNRPDEVLTTHQLDAGDQAALEQAAKVILRARWGNRVPAIVRVGAVGGAQRAVGRAPCGVGDRRGVCALRRPGGIAPRAALGAMPTTVYTPIATGARVRYPGAGGATMHNETLGQRIRRVREAYGISQVTLARCLDASTNAINLLEQGRIRDPHWQRLVAMAELLDVSLDYLAGRTDDPTPPQRPRPRTAAQVS